MPLASATANPNTPTSERSLEPRIETLYRFQLRHISQTVNRSFSVLMVGQYLACIAAAAWISPRTWTGAQSTVHFHVWMAIGLGAIITSLPVTMALLRPGTALTRHVVAVGQMLMSGLLIHVTGGRIETHFHVFGSLAFLAFYRDPAVLVTASAVVGADHLLRELYWPQSVFGVLATSSWRWLEHVGWVIFEDIFLFISIRQSQQMIRKSLEARAELERARDEAVQANRAKDDFIAVLSHELRTPLTPSLLNLADLTKNQGLSVAAREQVQLIKRNIELEARLIDDLLDVTRIANGKVRLDLGEVDLHECIDHALEIAHSELEGKRLKVTTQFNANDAVVIGDESRIRQVFFNLLINASKFTPSENWITVSTKSEEDNVRVEITDSGIGISAEVIPTLFERFQQGGPDVTRRFGGLGLGLSICRSIMELHGGGISVRSEGIGKGATFTLDFPRKAHALESKPATIRRPSLELSAPHVTPRILLVEDHSDTRDTLARLLRRAGHEVFTAESVGSALREAERNEFELLLSDLGLPDGSGYEIMGALGNRHIRGIALSGFGTEQDIQKSLQAGFSLHLSKPIEFERLKSAIDDISEAKNGSHAEPQRA